MFIVYPTNIDYLIPDVRLRIGDLQPSNTRFSDSLIRTALVSSVKSLQKRWRSRYLVFSESTRVEPLPSGYVYALDITPDTSTAFVVVPENQWLVRMSEGLAFAPSGLVVNDVFRNSNADFVSDCPPVIDQIDETPIVISTCLLLRMSQITSSADTFQSWSDGEFSFSNLGKERALGEMRNSELAELEMYFKRRLSAPITSAFKPKRTMYD
jgi:hypothetical protein